MKDEARLCAWTASLLKLGKSKSVFAKFAVVAGVFSEMCLVGG